MPVHSKHTTQRLKPKRVGKTREQLRRPVMKEEVFGYNILEGRGAFRTCGFLLFWGQQSKAVSPCVAGSRRGQFSQSRDEAVDIIKVIEDVNRDAQAFPSR